MVLASTNPPVELVERESADLGAPDSDTEALLPFTSEREDEEADLGLRVRDPLAFLERFGRPLRRFDPLRSPDRLRRLPPLPVFLALDLSVTDAASETVDLADLAVVPVCGSFFKGLACPDRAVRAALAARTALALDEAPPEALRPLPVVTAGPVQPACQE